MGIDSSGILEDLEQSVGRPPSSLSVCCQDRLWSDSEALLSVSNSIQGGLGAGKRPCNAQAQAEVALADIPLCCSASVSTL